MGKVIVSAYSVSIDGFGAGVNQDRKNPLGIRGEELHEWMMPNGSTTRHSSMTARPTRRRKP
jgi:hypothetical protein